MIDFLRLDHILISIPPETTEAARRFYSETLELKEISGNHPGGPMWFSIADIELHIREEKDHPVNSGRHPAFEVANLEAAKQFLIKKQITVTFSSDINGRDRCFFRDPWGNRFELIEYNNKVK